MSVSHAHVKDNVRKIHSHEGGGRTHAHLSLGLFDWGRTRASILRHYQKRSQERILAKERLKRQ